LTFILGEGYGHSMPVLSTIQSFPWPECCLQRVACAVYGCSCMSPWYAVGAS
jgi:hypothetical protein